MSRNSSRILKASNLGWLASLTAVDVFLVLGFIVPDLLGTEPFSRLALLRAATLSLAPVLIMLLTNLFSTDFKATLVFWRIRHALPGHRAFSALGPGDARVDMASLRRNIGKAPEEAAEQNALWYRLYKRVDGEPSVLEAHKGFLLWRDAAALSAVLALIVPAGMYYSLNSESSAALAATIFLIQYVLCALAARQYGNRFVCNVLALHSAKRIVGAARNTATG